MTMRIFGPSTGNLDAYDGVTEATVQQLDNGKWFAALRCKVARPGYDIPKEEDMFRTFTEEQDARDWLTQRILEVERVAS